MVLQNERVLNDRVGVGRDEAVAEEVVGLGEVNVVEGSLDCAVRNVAADYLHVDVVTFAR